MLIRNRNPEIVEILDKRPLKFRCRKCGQVWWPSIEPGRKIHPSAWQCPRGCKPQKKDEKGVRKNG